MKAIGIDLGTTNSCVAVMETSPKVLENAEGSRTTPSVVAFDKDILVGVVAKRQMVTNPKNTIASSKRLIGKMEGNDTRFKDGKLELNNELVSIEEVSAHIISKLVIDAEQHLGQKITEAVITVPAYFDEVQRQATKRAGEIAGLKVLRIINEPTAAALAYGLDKQEQTVLVFDLGGGTFDVSILDIDEGVIEVRATSGDNLLGGDDFDQRVLDHLVDSFVKQTGIKELDDQAISRLLEAAEKAKQELSSSLETRVYVPYLVVDQKGPHHLDVQLARSTYNDLVKDLVARIKQPILDAIKDAKAESIDNVIMIGGMSRTPVIKDLVEEIVGTKPHKGINPDEAVALGAAVQAGIIQGTVTDLLLLDVTPLTLGLETTDGLTSAIIERNTTIPTKQTQEFTTARDAQEKVGIHIVQGEFAVASENKSLGKFELTDIPPAERGVPRIDVTFSIDASGILCVSAKDHGTGNEQEITIKDSKMPEEEVAKLIAKFEDRRESDRKAKTLIESKAHAEKVLGLVAKSGIENQELDARILELQAAVEGDDPITIDTASERLENALFQKTKDLYRNPQ